MKPVALRKESVDRNQTWNATSTASEMSLSARRAWIEMWSGIGVPTTKAMSLSARRAWIEIFVITVIMRKLPRRSPQGERG